MAGARSESETGIGRAKCGGKEMQIVRRAVMQMCPPAGDGDGDGDIAILAGRWLISRHLGCTTTAPLHHLQLPPIPILIH